MKPFLNTTIPCETTIHEVEMAKIRQVKSRTSKTVFYSILYNTSKKLKHKSTNSLQMLRCNIPVI